MPLLTCASSPDDRELERWFDTCAEALEILRDMASNGDESARNFMRFESERLIRMTGDRDLQRLKPWPRPRLYVVEN